MATPAKIPVILPPPEFIFPEPPPAPVAQWTPMFPLPRLGEQHLVLPIEKSTLLATANETLGNAGTPSDGFDGDFAEIALALPAESALLAEFDADLTGAAFVDGQFDSGTLAPIAPDIAAVQAGNNSELAEFGPAVGANPPPPPPPSGGGGSAGGSDPMAGGVGDACVPIANMSKLGMLECAQ